MNLLVEALSKLSAFIDPALVLRYCLRYGVREISLEPHPLGIPGSYQDEKIYIDPLMDRVRVVRTIRKRHALVITEVEASLWIFLHELGHHVLRSDDQGEAERWAYEKFMEWRSRKT